MQQYLFRFGIPLAAVAAVVLAWDRFGWQGVVVAATALVLWLLLHYNRMMAVLKRATSRPIGYVDSAVMFNARLKSGASLLHVIAMTRALGALQSAKDQQPEIYRWSDGSRSHVDCAFDNGKLVRWQLVRPPAQDAGPDAPEVSDGPVARESAGP